MKMRGDLLFGYFTSFFIDDGLIRFVSVCKIIMDLSILGVLVSLHNHLGISILA